MKLTKKQKGIAIIGVLILGVYLWRQYKKVPKGGPCYNTDTLAEKQSVRADYWHIEPWDLDEIREAWDQR